MKKERKKEIQCCDPDGISFDNESDLDNMEDMEELDELEKELMLLDLERRQKLTEDRVGGDYLGCHGIMIV